MNDNFEQIKGLLQFDSEDDFYHLQIIKRRKEHPDFPFNSRVIKTYYIKSVENLDFYKEEIISICKLHNARACINLNRRSFEKIAFQLLRKVADQIMNKDYKSCRKAFESVCGAYSNEPNKKWILDIDDINVNALEIKDILYHIHPQGDKYIATIPTKNGYHLIVKPFNTMKFGGDKPIYDIHKDNPTILYIP